MRITETHMEISVFVCVCPCSTAIAPAFLSLAGACCCSPGMLRVSDRHGRTRVRTITNGISSTGRVRQHGPSRSRPRWSHCFARIVTGSASRPTGDCSAARGERCSARGATAASGRRPGSKRSRKHKLVRHWRPVPTTYGISGVTLQLNAGVPGPEIACRAGHTVAVLLRVYAGCIDGQDQLWNNRIDDALHLDSAP